MHSSMNRTLSPRPPSSPRRGSSPSSPRGISPLRNRVTKSTYLNITNPLDGTPKRKLKRPEIRFRVSDLLNTGPKPRISCVEETATLDIITDLIISNHSEFVVVKGKYGPPVGIVHLNDIVLLSCKKYIEWNNSFEFSFKMKNEFSKMNASDIIRQKQWLTISLIAPLADLLKLLSLPNARDVAILGEDHTDIISVVTRSDVFEFLYKKKNDLADIMKKKISECKVNHTLKPIDKMEFSIEYFRILWEKQKTGLWVSHGNTLLEKFLTMVGVCMEYCEVTADELSPRCCHSVHVYEVDTLQKALELIVHRCVQRMFVYDDIKQSPLGDLAIGDFLSEFQSYV